MHILHFCPHSGGVMYEWHQVHFLDELKRSGHKITDCNPVKILKRVGTAGEYSNILVDAAKNILNDPGPHILFATATDSTLEPGAVDYIRKLGMICINLSVDDLVVPFQVRKIGAHFDLHWTTFIGADEHLKKYGCKVIYMPMAANPYFFKPYHKRRSHILCFVGSRYGARISYLAALIKAGLPVKIRGAGWLEGSICNSKAKGICSSTINFKQLRMAGEFMRLATGRKIILGWHKKKIGDMLGKYDTSVGEDWDASGPLATFEEMVDLYSSCAVSLGILEAGNTYTLKKPLVYYRLRDFEAPMIGCAHIVRRVPELEQCFTDAEEMIFYDSIDDCIDKAKFYLAPRNYELCISIGERARKRAETEHTWTNRFNKMVEYLNL